MMMEHTHLHNASVMFRGGEATAVEPAAAASIADVTTAIATQATSTPADSLHERAVAEYLKSIAGEAEPQEEGEDGAGSGGSGLSLLAGHVIEHHLLPSAEDADKIRQLFISSCRCVTVCVTRFVHSFNR